MRDIGWESMTRLVADGVELGPGDKVSIFVTGVAGYAAAEAFVDECFRRGAVAQVVATHERFDLSALTHAPAVMLSQPPALEAAAMEWSDVHISFRAMGSPVVDADPERIAALRRGRGVVSTMRWEQTRWALVRVPTPEWADAMAIDFDDLLEQWVASFETDWADGARRMQELCDLLDDADDAVITDGTHSFEMDLRGRRWVPFSGNANWPDGELATAPVDDGSNGTIRFPGRFSFGGVLIRDLELDVEAGVIVRERAAEGVDFVRQLFDTDEGARRIGELGIGTNAALTTMTGDLLIDEKILGTAHIAPGRAYPQCGGINHSSLHWDIVKDLRGNDGQPAGSVRVGDTWLIENGAVHPLLLAAVVPPVVS